MRNASRLISIVITFDELLKAFWCFARRRINTFFSLSVDDPRLDLRDVEEVSIIRWIYTSVTNSNALPHHTSLKNLSTIREKMRATCLPRESHNWSSSTRRVIISCPGEKKRIAWPRDSLHAVCFSRCTGCHRAPCENAFFLDECKLLFFFQNRRFTHQLVLPSIERMFLGQNTRRSIHKMFNFILYFLV